jgi:hypothetical protein
VNNEMSDITDPQAVAFCNERIRPAADLLAQAYNYASQVLAEWTAHGGAVLVPNTSDPVVDGSATDGRPPVTGADVNLLVVRLSELKADFEASGAAKLNTILKVAVNTSR